jgi:hypothetical protein
LTFEAEPFLPNIGLGNIWNPQNNGSEDHGNSAPKDTEMKEAQISGDTFLPGTSAGSATRTNLTGKEDKASEAQMDYDWANDDLLGEEHEFNEATGSFLGIKKGYPINVKNAATIATPGSGVLSAPVRVQQSQPQSSKPANFLSSAALAPQLSTEGGSAREECLGQVQQPLLSASAAACDMQILKSCQQCSDLLDRDYTKVSVGDIGATVEEACADGAHHIADLFGAMLDAGVAADGMSKKELGSVMKMAVLSDGELTTVRRSKRNADAADVDSLEKAERRVAVKNLEEPQGNLNVNSFCSFSNTHIKKNLGGVGISLGNTDDLKIGSIALLKNVETERLRPSMGSNINEKECDSEEEEIVPDTFTISRLCGDLTEEVMDDNNADLDGVLVNVSIKVAKTKKKKKLNKNTTAKKKIVF